MRQVRQLSPIARFIFFATIAITSSISAEEHSVVFMTILINERACNVAIDTGSDSSALFRDAATRIDIRLSETDKSAKCAIGIGKLPAQTCEMMLIDAPPAGLKFDGILGWDQLSKLITEFDWDNGTVTFHEKVPSNVGRLQSAQIRKDATALTLENETDGGDGLTLIDTGSDSGVGLNAKLWKQWASQHADAPMTLVASWNYHDGPIASHQSWADEIKAGPIKLERVLVEEAQPLYTSLPKFEAVMGTAALCHYEVIIDGPGGMLYFKNHVGCKAKFSYNRTGAGFIPDDSGSYVAHVIDHSPAQRAGVHDGDTLKNINGIEVASADRKILMLKQFLNAQVGDSESPVRMRTTRSN